MDLRNFNTGKWFWPILLQIGLNYLYKVLLDAKLYVECNVEGVRWFLRVHIYPIFSGIIL